MKKFLTLSLVCCLVFLSSSTVFATATQWDTNDQKNLNYIATSVTSGGSLYNLVNNIYSRMNTINNNIVDIKGYLVHGRDSIATIVYNIQTWMSPIYNAIIESPVELRIIEGLLGYPTTDSNTGVTTWTSYLQELYNLQNNNGWNNSTSGQSMYSTGWDGSVSVYSFTPSNNWQQNMILLLQFMNNNISQSIAGLNYKLHNDQWGVVNLIDPLTLNSATANYISSDHMQELYLSNIGTSAARLAYVLASPERIEAQQAAAANEETVVDNFIDSSGSGAASTSDFGSVSDLSSGFKNNISTDANVSGIWNIFNADNFGWFSQETADQLDTSGSSKKTLKSSGLYPTPLLDKQTEDILKYIGGDNND